ncbi:hypothetical protein R3P38DRAFT_2901601 [Favolaschia claudopus]|uniref:Uncharacterized protein n=1 Tax=Favolaschia claudopus TaxID=2862362 RepID=A0AAW0CLJ3_9AGAR
MHSDVTIYDDSDVNQIQSISPTQMHREVDLEIVAADSEGYVKTYIILPVNYLWACHRAGMVGEGKNLWPNVEIHELADLYATLYDQVVADAGQAELDKYFGGSAYLGSNSRCRATRSRSIGWKPVKSTDEMLGTIRAEMEALIQKKGSSA